LSSNRTNESRASVHDARQAVDGRQGVIRG
jgi:hypothetical protein